MVNIIPPNIGAIITNTEIRQIVYRIYLITALILFLMYLVFTQLVVFRVWESTPIWYEISVQVYLGLAVLGFGMSDKNTPTLRNITGLTRKEYRNAVDEDE